MTNRRHFLALARALLAAGCATTPSMSEFPPVVVFHGNGSNASIWQTRSCG